MKTALLWVVALVTAVDFSSLAPTAEESKMPASPASNSKTDEHLEQVTLGSGCFWCTEAVFQELKGVKSAVSGYSGGRLANPTYKQVCSGTTGHAEVIQVAYDPSQISFADILRVF